MTLHFTGSYIDKNQHLDISITLIEFVDENSITFIYSPHLDLTGYGKNSKEAKDSFNVVLDDFFSYTLNKNTLWEELTSLGWKTGKKSIEAPKMKTLVKSREFLSDLFDKYPVNTYHQKVGIPNYA